MMAAAAPDGTCQCARAPLTQRPWPALGRVLLLQEPSACAAPLP